MYKQKKKNQIWNSIEIVSIFLLLAFTLLTDFIKIPYSKNAFYNRLLSKTIQQSCGSIAAILLFRRLEFHLFKGISNPLYLLPCLLIALNNMQWSALFNGKMQLLQKDAISFILFALYCLSTGLFEELIFRGILFGLIVNKFPKSKKGFLLAYLSSALLFGLAHLLNGFSASTFLQVGYSILTGGLFAFCLIKTKNIFCCAMLHSVYNFCGLLFDASQGLGSGVVFDLGTILSMLIIDIIIGVFILYKVWTYTDDERKQLYNQFKITY